MTALQDTMRLSSQLNSLKDKNINDPKVLKPYILTLLELEKAIEAYEYEQVVRLNKENERVSGLLKDIMLGTDPKEVSQLLAKIAQMLKNSAEQVSKGTAADDFTKAKDYLHKSMSRGDLSKSVLKEIDEIQKRAAMMRKEEMAFETVKPLKSRLLLAFFQELVEEIEWDFERVYQMKVQLHDHYEYLRTADDFFTLHENRDFGPAFDQLTIHMKKIDEELKNKILFLAQAIANTAHAIDHLSRHTTLMTNMGWAFEKGKFDLRRAMRKEFMARGWQYQEVRPLEISYHEPWVSFSKEFAEIRKMFPEASADGLDRLYDVISRLSKLIAKEYEHKCDSPYHGLEHMTQVFITSLRIFKGCYKPWALDIKDLFVLAVSAIMHDIGYFTEKFKHVSPGYLSSMNHTYHEKKSAELAVGYLEHMKPDIMKLFFPSEKEWSEFVKAVQNVISATQVFAAAFRPKNQTLLQQIIRAADLLEMTSEYYINYLVPLYIENKIGNPQGPWPANVDELLRGTPYFMTQLDVVKQRVEPMMKYLSAYPIYEQNRQAIVNNLNKYFEAMKDVSLSVDKIQEAAKKAA